MKIQKKSSIILTKLAIIEILKKHLDLDGISLGVIIGAPGDYDYCIDFKRDLNLCIEEIVEVEI